MKCYKDKGIIIFDFEDGKRATFDMNTGETIGKMGKPVKSLSAALAGYSIDEVLNSFTDKKYKEFLYYVHDNFTPNAYRRNGYNWTNESRVKNLGTLLKYANEYKTFEQYFRADVKASYRMRTPLSEVPKGLLKLCRQTGKQIEEHLITYYKKAPDIYNFLFRLKARLLITTQSGLLLNILFRADIGVPVNFCMNTNITFVRCSTISSICALSRV